MLVLLLYKILGRDILSACHRDDDTLYRQLWPTSSTASRARKEWQCSNFEKRVNIRRRGDICLESGQTPDVIIDGSPREFTTSNIIAVFCGFGPNIDKDILARDITVLKSLISSDGKISYLGRSGSGSYFLCSLFPTTLFGVPFPLPTPQGRRAQQLKTVENM